jgi:OOP family OmpA-OmpF porin
MNKQYRMALGALLFLAAMNAHGQESTPHGWYMGLDVGTSKVDRDPTYGAVVTASDDESTAFSLRAGYRFTAFFALEAGYTDVGDFSSSFDSLCPNPTFAPCPSYTSSTTFRGLQFNAVGIWPIAEHFQLKASAGAFYRQLKATVDSTLYGHSSESENDSDFVFGAGIGIPVNDRLDISIDWTRYRMLGLGYTSSTGQATTFNEGETSIASLGVRWRF